MGIRRMYINSTTVTRPRARVIAAVVLDVHMEGSWVRPYASETGTNAPCPAASFRNAIDDVPERVVGIEVEGDQAARHDEFELAECVPGDGNDSGHIDD